MFTDQELVIKSHNI